MMNDLLASLSERSEKNIEFRSRTLHKDSYSFKRSAYTFTLNNWALAWNEVLNNKDLNRAKHYFNENGFIDIKRAELFNHRLFDMQNPRDNFCCAVLSDNKSLIEQYSNIEYKIEYTSRNKKIVIPFSEFANQGELVAIYSLCILNVLKQDFEELKKSLVIFKSVIETKKYALVLLPDYEFLESLLSRNKDLIKEKIEIFLTNKLHKQRMKDELILKEYISQPAILYLKVCWLLGFEIEINHKFIPMELMPVNPLSVYEDSYKSLIK